MKKLKKIVGITAVSAVVSMNLIHAWNNYGITDSCLLMSIKATPAKDSTELNCETKPDVTPIVHYNAKESKTKYITHCLAYEERHYYKIVNSQRTLIAISKENYIYNECLTAYETGFSYSDIASCKDIEIKNRNIIEYEGESVDCIDYIENKCCYPQGVLNCTQVLKNSTL